MQKLIADVPDRGGWLETGQHFCRLERRIDPTRDRARRDRIETGEKFTPFERPRLEDLGANVISNQGDTDFFGDFFETFFEEAFRHLHAGLPVFITHLHRSGPVKKDHDGAILVGIVLLHDEARKHKDSEGEEGDRQEKREPFLHPAQPGGFLVLLREGLEKDEGGDPHPLRAAPEKIEHHWDDSEKQQPQQTWIEKLHQCQDDSAVARERRSAGK